MDTLATLLEDQGKFPQAEAMFRDALARARKGYGEMNLNTARLQHSVGWVLWKQGKYGEAEPFLRMAAVNIPKTYGPTYRGVRIATSSLAHELNSLRQARAAESTARQALAMYRQAPTDRGVPHALIALSHALIAQRRANEAIAYLREAMEVIEQSPQAAAGRLRRHEGSPVDASAAGTHRARADRFVLRRERQIGAGRRVARPAAGVRQGARGQPELRRTS
jgi:tetratricopeptide (TPR) repeat protein